jgi:hypothetical protein
VNELTPRSTSQEKRREEDMRRLGGRNPSCVICGETETSALTGTAPNIICYECRQTEAGKSAIEVHHADGKHNDPRFTIPIPANDHRLLSDLQTDWPMQTLRNPDGSPLLKASAALRGFLDILRILIERIFGWIPPFLESLDSALQAQCGEQWWTMLNIQQEVR